MQKQTCKKNLFRFFSGKLFLARSQTCVDSFVNTQIMSIFLPILRSQATTTLSLLVYSQRDENQADFRPAV
jgi:hypothetical protein